MKAIGVDGCRAGWVAAAAHDDGTTELRLLRRLRDLPEARSIAIDVPLGLPREAGLRAFDRLARDRLGARASCVFPPPARWMLRMTSHRELCREARRRGEPAISAQCWNIVPKIREAARVSRTRRLVECHPEVAFVELAGRPLPSKKTAAGVRARIRLLRARFADLDERLAGMPWKRSEVALDDALDAYACLASALRSRGLTGVGAGRRPDGWRPPPTRPIPTRRSRARS